MRRKTPLGKMAEEIRWLPAKLECTLLSGAMRSGSKAARNSALDRFEHRFGPLDPNTRACVQAGAMLPDFEEEW